MKNNSKLDGFQQNKYTKDLTQVQLIKFLKPKERQRKSLKQSEKRGKTIM